MPEAKHRRMMGETYRVWKRGPARMARRHRPPAPGGAFESASLRSQAAPGAAAERYPRLTLRKCAATRGTHMSRCRRFAIRLAQDAGQPDPLRRTHRPPKRLGCRAALTLDGPVGAADPQRSLMGVAI
jgi:hypothetical protein